MPPIHPYRNLADNHPSCLGTGLRIPSLDHHVPPSTCYLHVTNPIPWSWVGRYELQSRGVITEHYFNVIRYSES